MTSRIRRLKESSEMFRNKSSLPLPQFQSPPPASIPKLRFLQKKLDTYRLQLEIVSRSFFETFSLGLSITADCFQKCLESKIPVSFDFESLESHSIHELMVNPQYRRLQRRLVSIDAHLRHFHTNSKTVSEMTSIATVSLAASARHYAIPIEFGDRSLFDSDLFDYFTALGIDVLDAAARALSPHTSAVPTFCLKTHNVRFAVKPIVSRRPRVHDDTGLRAPDFGPLEQLYVHLVKTLSADTPEKQGVVRCALVRLMADRLYLIDPIVSEPNVAISEGLEMVRALTVDEMRLPPGVFDGFRSSRVAELANTNEVVREVATFLEVIAFTSSPIDIAESIAILSKTVGAIADQASRTQPHTLPFDDFFVVFAIMFAAAPISNACGIAALFKVFSFLEYSPPFLHAITAFSALIEFIRDFPQQAQAKTVS
jgi:hypothetical protein